MVKHVFWNTIRKKLECSFFQKIPPKSKNPFFAHIPQAPWYLFLTFSVPFKWGIEIFFFQNFHHIKTPFFCQNFYKLFSNFSKTKQYFFLVVFGPLTRVMMTSFEKIFEKKIAKKIWQLFFCWEKKIEKNFQRISFIKIL